MKHQLLVLFLLVRGSFDCQILQNQLNVGVMKTLLILLLLLVVPVMGNPKTKTPPKKQAIEMRVDQILPEGLLIISGQSLILLVGHPDHKKIVDGQLINCYALRTDEVFRYTDVSGAMRAARVYRYYGKRLGR